MIIVPFHQDERLDDAHLPLPGDNHRIVVPVLPTGEIWSRLTVLYDAVAAEVAADPAPVVFSGDCLVALGVLAGVQRKGVTPSLVWYDAHGDVHTAETSTSGYLGGMALRLALGAHRDQVADRFGLQPLAEDRATLVDARDLDPAEAAYLSSAAVHRCDVGSVVLPDGPIVLHVDVDVIDGAELPGLLFPVPGGPATGAVLDSLARVLATGRVAAVSVACPWHPGTDERRVALLRALTDLVSA